MSMRTRSTTRPRRVEVERMSAPQAEMSTAGVIIAVRTATAEESASIVYVAGRGSRARRLWGLPARAGKRAAGVPLGTPPDIRATPPECISQPRLRARASREIFLRAREKVLARAK